MTNTAKTVDTYELLVSMLKAYEQSLKDDDLYYLIDHDHPNDKRVKKAIIAIRRIWELDQIGGNRLEVLAVEWWRKHREELIEEGERFIYLHYLLSSLNDLLGQKARRNFKVDEGTLVLGRTWWKSYSERSPESKYAMVDSPPRNFSQKPFSNIRLSKLSPKEWIQSNGFSHHLNQNLLENESLTIGLCSLDGRAKTRLEGTRVVNSSEKEYGFVSAEILTQNGHKEVLDELTECVRWAHENKADILAFPELSISPSGVDHILKTLNAFEHTSLALVFPGSFHIPISRKDSYENQSPILIHNGKSFEKASHYSKTERFTMPAPNGPGHPFEELTRQANQNGCNFLTEDIRRNSSMRVISSPIGYIGLEICKDNLNPNEATPSKLKTYPIVDHLFILAMNASEKAWFNGNAESLGSLYGFSTFFVNASQAIPPASFQRTVLQFWWYPTHLQKGRGEGKVYIGEKAEFLKKEKGRKLISIPITPSDGYDLTH